MPPPSKKTTTCPVCGKVVNSRGIAAHQRNSHSGVKVPGKSLPVAATAAPSGHPATGPGPKQTTLEGLDLATVFVALQRGAQVAVHKGATWQEVVSAVAEGAYSESEHLSEADRNAAMMQLAVEIVADSPSQYERDIELVKSLMS